MDKKINRFVKLPLIIICVVICISGLRWLISQEPWILDQVANEERLAMTFNELFSIEGNNTLAAYLKQIYRFLGLYVFGTGFVFLMFSKIDLFNQRSFRNRYFIALGTLLFFQYFTCLLLDTFLSFYLYNVGAILLYLISLYNHFRIVIKKASIFQEAPFYNFIQVMISMLSNHNTIEHISLSLHHQNQMIHRLE